MSDNTPAAVDREAAIKALHTGSGHEHEGRAATCGLCAQQADRLFTSGILRDGAVIAENARVEVRGQVLAILESQRDEDGIAPPWVKLFREAFGITPADIQALDQVREEGRAETPRRAAALMRERAKTSGPRTPRDDAVSLLLADWLDEVAEEYEADPSDYCEGKGHRPPWPYNEDLADECTSWFCANVDRAFAVARAYLGEQREGSTDA